MEKTNIYLNLFFVHFAYFAIFSTLLFDIWWTSMRCVIVDFLVEQTFLQIPHFQADENLSIIWVSMVTVWESGTSPKARNTYNEIDIDMLIEI